MQHLAIIPDGNRRWARTHKLETLLGHTRGKEVVRSATQVCLKNKISYLSIYTFSRENFKRPEHEKKYLFNMLSTGFNQDKALFHENGIRLRFLGDINLFPEEVQVVVRRLEEETSANNALQLNLLFGYGAQHEIVSAVKSIAQRVKSGELDIEHIDEQLVGQTLFTAGMPDPDLIVRTGGAVRLSNFLLYQAAYSEFKFLDCFWPEVTAELLQQCVDDFKGIKRNFGA